MRSELLWQAQSNSEGVPAIARQLSDILLKEGDFCLWLTGELGAGKTFFSGHLLHALGLPKDVPVLSPTFTYMTEYSVGSKTFAHMDLYRLVDGDIDSVEGIMDQRGFSGVLVEWPERCAKAPSIQPSHRLDIEFVDEDQRQYKLYRSF